MSRARARVTIGCITLACAATAAFGCEAFFPLPDSREAPTDGGGPTDDGGGQDVATDDASREAGDGGADVSDAGPANDAAVCDASFCTCISPQPAFCDDFERTSVNGAWTKIVQTGTGHIELVDAGSHGQAVRFYALDAGASSSLAYLQRHVSISANDVRYAFDMQIVASPTQGGSSSAILVDLPDARTAEAYLELHPNADVLTYLIFDTSGDGGGTTAPMSVALSPPLSLNRWMRVELHATLTGTPHVTVTIDGTEVVSTDVRPEFAPGTFAINAGISYAHAGDAYDVLVDNVTVE